MNKSQYYWDFSLYQKIRSCTVRVVLICVILNLYSRKVISYKVSDKQSTQLITSTFKTAYKERSPEENLIFHIDRGCQYISHKFQSLLKSLNVKQSLSPKARPHYNAIMESFFANLKKEELYRNKYHSIREFKDNIEKYINFYNVNRPHYTLYCKSPEAYEQMYYQMPQINSK